MWLHNTTDQRIELPWGAFVYAIDPNDKAEMPASVASEMLIRFSGLKEFQENEVLEVKNKNKKEGKKHATGN